MQPFDALSLLAVVEEARPVIVGRKVDKVYQPAKDEVVIALRGRGSTVHFLVSANAALGRACLTREVKNTEKISNFCQFLRKHLAGALLLKLEVIKGERVIDLVFACPDEIGQNKVRVLTGEIMGRHSNLIFWDKASAQILAVSHVVTSQMSRLRELAPGLSYVRPPRQAKPNIFTISQDQFQNALANEKEIRPDLALEASLLQAFSGLSRQLAEDLSRAPGNQADWQSALWQNICLLNQEPLALKPAMAPDLTGYWLLDLAEKANPDLILYESANKLIDDYYFHLSRRQEYNRTYDHLLANYLSEKKKLQSKMETAKLQMAATENLNQWKKYGDLILTHIQEIRPGQLELCCADYEDASGKSLAISLNPNLSPQANAQNYYKQFSKARLRRKNAEDVIGDLCAGLTKLEDKFSHLENASSLEELKALESPALRNELKPAKKRKAEKSTLLSITTPDGWTIFVGRNRKENDFLLSKVAKGQDIWLHVAGTSGAHVVIKVPVTGMMPPQSTFKIAAELAARHSSAKSARKVRVIYTMCKYLRKSPGDKAGVVRYENEKSFDIEL